jgi:hypothetical protein
MEEEEEDIGEEERGRLQDYNLKTTDRAKNNFHQ